MPNSTHSHSNRSKILHLLKTQGEMVASQLSEQLQMTSMGARQHLESMEKDGLVTHQFVSEGKGRPKKKWLLTDKAQSQFPDSHANLLVNLLGHMQEQLGENAYESLIKVREEEMLVNYRNELARYDSLSEKLNRLAEIRTIEGYMAQVVEENGELLFVENHCPICAAANKCQQFCRSELSIFGQVLECEIVRVEYILEGARRCAYKVTAS